MGSYLDLPSPVTKIKSVSNNDVSNKDQEQPSTIRDSLDCRICLGSGSAEQLIRPCHCRGTVAGVHRSCLQTWMLQANTSQCELCRFHYRVRRTYKTSFLNSLIAWAGHHRRLLVAEACKAAIYGLVSVLHTNRAYRVCERAVIVGAIGGERARTTTFFAATLFIWLIWLANGLLTTCVLLRLQEHQESWRQWRQESLILHIALPDEQDLYDTSSGDSDVTDTDSSDGGAAFIP